MVTRKSPREIAKMRKAGRVVALTLKRLAEIVRPGVTTAEIDRYAEDTIRELGGLPSFKGLYGFPGSICISVNEEVVHGIPGSRVIREGDIVSLDVGAMVEGYHGDGAVTLPMEPISEEAKRLLEVTRKALDLGIAAARPGNRVVDISRAIQEYVEGNGFSVVRSLTGHGIGRKVHEEPQVPNFVVPGVPGPILRPGMTLAIEPMVNAGFYEVAVSENNWTVVTRDFSLSAHFENTVAITQSEAEILTVP